MPDLGHLNELQQRQLMSILGPQANPRFPSEQPPGLPPNQIPILAVTLENLNVSPIFETVSFCEVRAATANTRVTVKERKGCNLGPVRPSAMALCFFYRFTRWQAHETNRLTQHT